MKKNIILIISILVLICVVTICYIFINDKNIINKTEIISLNCESDNEQNKLEYNCSLEGNVSEYEVSAISATIEENDKYKIISITPDEIWQGNGENGNIDLYTDENKKNRFKIAKIKIELLNNNIDEFELLIKNINLYDENFLEHKVKNVSQKISVNK